jgi:Mor family transcriptional regulator
MVTIRRAKLIARFRVLLAEEGLSSEWAPGLAQKLTAAVWEDYGPGTHYLESLRPHSVQERNARILRAFDGTNGADIARREGLTPRQVQRIVSPKRQLRRIPRTLTDGEKAQVRKDFNGINRQTLAQRFGTSEEAIQAALEEKR